jgi:hypothetical protein
MKNVKTLSVRFRSIGLQTPVSTKPCDLFPFGHFTRTFLNKLHIAGRRTYIAISKLFVHNLCQNSF